MSTGKSVFSCLRCSECCFFADQRECPVVLPHEVKYIRVLANYVGVQEQNFEPLPTGLYMWIIRGFCPFYDKASRACRIHSEKPLACTMFPLLINPSTLELLVSSACKWIRENIGKLLANLGEEVEEVFSAEFNAVKELIKILYAATTGGLISLIFISDNAEEVISKLVVNGCVVVKLLKSSIVKGLHLVLLSSCSKGGVENSLRNFEKSINVLSIEEEQVLIGLNERAEKS